MKYVKMLGLAAVAAMALMAFVGAGTASATELYSGNTTLGAGTTLHATLEPASTLRLTSTDTNTTYVTCATSTVHGKITNPGSAASTPVGDIEGLTWGSAGHECSATTDTLSLGELEIHHITGTHNGTVTGKGSVVTVNLFGVSCRYGTGNGTQLGTLTGTTDTTKHATMDINAIINEQEPKQFLCPDTAEWIGSYVVTTPTGLNVRAS